MQQIKFGTDGWRAIIADDFTVENLKRVAEASAFWIKSQSKEPSVVIGYDCRFGGKLFSEVTAQVMAKNNIHVYLSENFVSTPMISLAAKKLNASCGIIITASHNPPSYNGFKIKGNYGGPALPSMIDEIEALIPDTYNESLDNIESLITDGKVEYHDFENMYIAWAEEHFDMEAIRNSPFRIAYDAMYGAGQNAAKKLLPKAITLHADYNPSFHGQAPEPILKNLQEFADLIKVEGDIDLGFATDGDADRIGILDGNGNFVDSHHIILMLINYLHKYKGLSGKVVRSFSCTSRISDMCEKFGLEEIVTKIGFKYICEYMVNENVLVGGEESGGIAVTQHIPERDGIWIALTLLEYMAKSEKSLADLIKEVYDIVGEFAMERVDLHIREDQKQRIIQNCKSGAYTNFGKYKVVKVDDLDGFKFFLENNSWVMIRASGTEPVLRTYSEANSSKEAFEILEETRNTILELQPAE
jgi:phosphomannomutase